MNYDNKILMRDFDYFYIRSLFVQIKIIREPLTSMVPFYGQDSHGSGLFDTTGL